jgi:hypothetical protein
MKVNPALRCASLVLALASLTFTSHADACTVPFFTQFLSRPIVVTASQDFVVLGHVAADGTSVDVVTTFQGELNGRVELVRPSAPRPCRSLRDTGDDVLVFGRFEGGAYIADEFMRVDDEEERLAVAELLREKTRPSPTLAGEIDREACKTDVMGDSALAVVDYELDAARNLRSATIRETSARRADQDNLIRKAALELLSSPGPHLDSLADAGRVIVELACR